MTTGSGAASRSTQAGAEAAAGERAAASSLDDERPQRSAAGWLIRKRSMQQEEQTTAEDGGDDDDVADLVLPARTHRQASVDSDVEAEQIVDVTDCIDSMDMSLEPAAPPPPPALRSASPLPPAAALDVGVSSSDDATTGTGRSSMSVSIDLAPGSVTQERMHGLSLSTSTPSPSPHLTPSPISATASQGEVGGGSHGALHGRSASLSHSLLLPSTAVAPQPSSSSSSSYSSLLQTGGGQASSLSLSSSPFLVVPDLSNIPPIPPSLPPPSNSPPPASPFLSPPSPHHYHHRHHHHHLSNSPPRRKKKSGNDWQPASPPASHHIPHRHHSDAELRRASSSSSSSASSSSHPETIETSQVSTSYNEQGQKQINQYVVEGGELGHGTSGQVKLVYSLTEQQYYAMKEVSKSVAKKKRLRRKDNGGQDSWEALKREIAIMKKARHDNVVRLVEVMDDVHADRLYLIMEYCDGGAVMSMDSAADPIPLPLVKRYLRDALLGLDYLHYHNIIHRDIKPDNLLLAASGQCKIGDLGMSTLLATSSSLLTDYVTGTPAFRPPEVCEGRRGFNGQAADVWSLGVTVFYLLYGELPFLGSSLMLLVQSIIQKELRFPDDDGGSEVKVEDGCKRLIARMLEKDPARRVTVEEMLQDEWLTEGGQWQPDRSWREAEERERRRRLRLERLAGERASATAADDDDDDVDEKERAGAVGGGAGEGSGLHEIIVTPAEVSESITMVNSLLLVVKIKRRMQQHRRATRMARSASVDDRTPHWHAQFRGLRLGERVFDDDGEENKDRDGDADGVEEEVKMDGDGDGDMAMEGRGGPGSVDAAAAAAGAAAHNGAASRPTCRQPSPPST